MTPIEFLESVGTLYNSPKTPEELLSLVELSDAGDRKIKHLSAGMYRRLGVAQALVGNPRLVFLDEPTSNLDVGGRDLVIQLIMGIHQEEDVSFFITSHILTELERACTEVGFINKGRLIEKGDLRDLVDRYTQHRVRVVSSDSSKLKEQLQECEEIIDILVEGSATLIIEVSDSIIKDIESYLKEIVKDTPITIYEVRRTGDLEDAFRKVIGHA